MKRVVILPVCIVIVILAISCLAFNYFNVQGSIKEIGDNDYNNKFCNIALNQGSLLRIDDKLYYNYKPKSSYIKYGLYEISKNGNKRLYSPGFAQFPYHAPLFVLQEYNKELLVSPSNFIPYGIDIQDKYPNYIIKLNLNNQSFEISNLLNGVKKDTINNYYAFNDKIYLIGEKAIYIYKDNSVKSLIEIKDVDNLGIDFKYIFFADSGFYYFSKSKKAFCCYDLETKSINKLIEESSFKHKIETVDYILPDFCVINNNLIFYYSSPDCTKKDNVCLYKANLKTKRIGFLAKLPLGHYYTNYRGNTLYVGSETSGIYSIDIYSKKTAKISDKHTKGVFIVDDKFIYFIDDEAVLYRTNGKTTEKVFG